MALLALALSCAHRPDMPIQELTYRGSVPDSVFLRQQDIEKIAEMVNHQDALTEYKREVNNMILKVAGTLITLLLSGLIWLLKRMLDAVPKLQVEVNKLNLALAASKQFNTDQKVYCDKVHEDIEHRLEKLEK